MKRERLKRLVFMALCCDMGIFSKKLIVPAANLVTDALHIPGGVGSAFSLMFIVIAALFVPRFGAATLMGAVQSGIALCMGTVGSMGALAPVGYILPALAVDSVLYFARRLDLGRKECAVVSNAVGSLVACLAANLIVFRLQGLVLALYACVALLSGTLCGVLAGGCAEKLDPIFGKEVGHETIASRKHCGAASADRDPRRSASDNAHA